MDRPSRPAPVSSLSRSNSVQRTSSFQFTPEPSSPTAGSGGATSPPPVQQSATTSTGAGGSSSRASSRVASPISENAPASWPYSNANSSQSSVSSDNTTVSHSAIPGFMNRSQSFGMSAGSTHDRPDYSEAKILVAMVGLPARGKSYLSNKLQRYLLWLEYEVKVFNVGQLRRAKYARLAQVTGKKADQSANFFDCSNEKAKADREAMAAECLEQAISWLKKGGNVGIHGRSRFYREGCVTNKPWADATNSTRKRRQAIVDRLKREKGIKLVFIESMCTDPATIAANIAHKIASGDPDYDGMPPEQAERDFKERIKHYESTYEPIDEERDRNMPYIKMVNVGSLVTVNKIDGYLQSRIAFYLTNLHLTPRSIFFTRHGESQYNVEGKIGGDAPLSTQGEKYMEALPSLVKDVIGDKPLTVWTSTLQRTIQTASKLPYEKLTWKSLDELDAGVCDGMTYEQIAEAYPEDYAARDEDKFNYRYRGGESYRDVVIRLEPVILELERQENILVVCHQAVLRCLYAYFHNLSQDELPYIKIPLHTVIKLTPKAYGCDEKRYKLPIEAVDTFRAPTKPVVQHHPGRASSNAPSPSTTRPGSAAANHKTSTTPRPAPSHVPEDGNTTA